MNNLIIFIISIIVFLLLFDLFIRSLPNHKFIFFKSSKILLHLNDNTILILTYIFCSILVIFNGFESFLIGLFLFLLIKYFYLSSNANNYYLYKIAKFLSIFGCISTFICCIYIFVNNNIYNIKINLSLFLYILNSIFKIVKDLFLSFIIILFFIIVIDNIKKGN